MKVVVTPRGFAKCGLHNVKVFEDAGLAVEYNATGNAYTKEEFYEKTADADGVIVGVESVDKAYIDAHPALKAVVKFGVGTDNIDIEYCKSKNIFVGRTVGSNSRSVAETAMSFIFADSKNLFESISDTRNNGWAKMTGYEIEGKTVGVIGFGAIGKKVAQMSSALGMNVLVYDPYLKDGAEVESIGGKVAAYEDILKAADFLSLHMPLTPDTVDFVAMKELRMMKPSAVLINTARGKIVNEKDLYEALQGKVIKAAYFDVLENEPPENDEPLLTLPNFYLTPHIASRSAEAERKTADIATAVIIEALTK